MWNFFFLYLTLSASSMGSELMDLLETTNQFFDEFLQVESPIIEAEDIKSMIKRSYNLQDEHKLSKRSIDENEPLVRDKYGVYLLSDIKDVAKIPIRFPNDINILSSHNLLYIISLEANGTDPEIQRANDLVVFQYSSIQGIKEVERVGVLGGTKSAVYSFQNVTFLISAEHDAENTPDSFQGSAVYNMIDRGGKIHLEKIQILNVIQPNDVKFWEHQDQLYLAIGTNIRNDTRRSGTIIYKWLGQHFDSFQVIKSKNVKSVMPFSIGSFMYIAVANYQDEYGNVDVESEIFKFSLHEMKFKSFQKIKTHGARDISHFKFEDPESKESEHFLVVSNFLGKNSQGELSTLTQSVMYKYSSDYFVPFQSFKLQGASQWLPVKGSNGEFLLLASTSNGIIGYQYDGWRFTQVPLEFGQSPFGNNIYSMRAFQYFGDIFLTVADKSSYGNNINLWKLSFTNKNDLEQKYNEVQNWCNNMLSEFGNDTFDEVMGLYHRNVSSTDDSVEESEEEKLEGENLTAEDLQGELRDELEQLTLKTENLEKLLTETEENLKNDFELPIVIGSSEIASLDVKCTSQDCCRFKSLKVIKVNGEDLTEFQENIVPLDEDLADSIMEFEHLIVEDDLSSSTVNKHPSETLIDVSSNTFINAGLVINGTVMINGELTVNGSFNGVVPDKEHLLLDKELEDSQDQLWVDSLKVKNLNLSGNINGAPIEELLHIPEIDLQNHYKELKVNNLVVEGLVGGYNLTHVLNEALKNSGSQEIDGDLEANTIEAEEVIITSEEISNKSLTDVINMYHEHLCETNPELFLQEEDFRSADEDFADGSGKDDDHERFIVIVEGFLQAKDISDTNNSLSLLDIINNGYYLNESFIESEFEFYDFQTDNVEVEVINGIPVNTWVTKDSDEVQVIRGVKKFTDNIHVNKEVSAEKINGIELDKLRRDGLKLEEDQVIAADLHFDTITCNEIETNFAQIGKQRFEEMGRLEVRETITTDLLKVENLTVYGDIDSISWERMLQDSVFGLGDEIPSNKTIDGSLRVNNLNVSGSVNDLPFEEFVALTSKDTNKILLYRNVTLDEPLSMDELYFEGFLDSVLQPKFEHEWLLTDGNQIITGPVTFENVTMISGSSLMNETINNINLRKLFTRSLKINEDAKIKHLYTSGKIKADRIDVGGTLNGADFNGSVVRSKSPVPQHLSGEWLFNKGLFVSGSLIIDGHVSGLNLSHLCALKDTDKVNLIVGGNVELQQEPKVVFVNGVDIHEKTQEVWMRTENVTFKGENLSFGDIQLERKSSLGGYLNDVNLTHVSKYYLSKTQNRVISSDFEFDELVIEKWCRMHKAKVGGTVNGVNLAHWARNVLLQDEDQIVWEKLRFEIFQTSDLKIEGSVNGLDLSKDVLRLDVDDAIVEGEKTFQAINVLNLTLEDGKKLQGVDIDRWKENLVKTTGNVIIKGSLTLNEAIFNGPFTVNGKVNDFYLDSDHILTTNGNQVITGIKRFDYLDRPNEKMKIRYLEVSGPINGIDLDDLIKNQAYSNRNLVFTQPKTFAQGLVADTMEVDGLFQGVDVTGMCNDVFNPVDVNEQLDDYLDLLNHTKTLIRVVQSRAFIFDYFDLIQTLKPNVKAVVPIKGSDGNFLLAVFTQTTMKFMKWDEYSEGFTTTDGGLNLVDDITFVTSETTKNGSLLYIENDKSAKIFESHLLKEIPSTETSCVAAFHLKPLNKSCIFIGQKWNSSRILCNSFVMNDLQTYQWLESRGSVQVSVLTINNEVYIAVINKEEVVDKFENTLTIYRFHPKLHHFYVAYSVAEVNPVALTSISYKDNHYLVSASGHLPESIHNSVLSIFKFHKNHKMFIRSQSIMVDTPVDVHFAVLPSSELALYVLTSNPTKPFVVFLHRGIQGFVEETSGLSLHAGSKLYSFTDPSNQHFVIISGFGRGQILKAGFKGDKPT